MVDEDVITAVAPISSAREMGRGSMTAVVRVGDTVRRTAGPWTPTIHELLRHVRGNGFDCVPEPLGLDDHGREMLSLLPGTAATYPPKRPTASSH